MLVRPLSKTAVEYEDKYPSVPRPTKLLVIALLIPAVLMNPCVPNPTTVDANSVGSMKLLIYSNNPSLVDKS